MKPHHFTPGANYNSADPNDEPLCELCGHELDGVELGDADEPAECPKPCSACGKATESLWYQGPDTSAPLVCFECFDPLLTYAPARA